MKGIVFSEFIEMVEDAFSPEIADEIIESSDLPSGGAYTSVGTYDHNEMVTLVVALSEKTSISVPELLETFGQHMFTRFVELFPHFFKDVNDSFTFLKSLDNYIHVEVRKLYPDADLPKFGYDDSVENQLKMEYQSKRGFADLACGLINGCVKYFNENIEVSRQVIEENTHVKFILVKTT